MPPRRNNSVSDVDRQRIGSSFENGEDFVSLAISLGVKRTTAYTVVRRYQQTGVANRRPRAGGRNSSLDREAIDFLVMLIEDNPCITLKEMNTLLREVFPRKPRVTTMTISRSLQGELITLKQVRNIPVNRNAPNVKEQRVAYANWMYDGGINRHRVYYK